MKATEMPRDKAEMKAAYTTEITNWVWSFDFSASLPGQMLLFLDWEYWNTTHITINNMYSNKFITATIVFPANPFLDPEDADKATALKT
jgi:hypothetical protein